jgi:hypothetical protein
MSKLRVVPMATAFGLTWGLGMMILGWISGGGWGARIVEVLSSLYIGFASTFVGGILGGLWGFADGFLGGLVLTVLYNALAGERTVAARTMHEQPAH